MKRLGKYLSIAAGIVPFVWISYVHLRGGDLFAVAGIGVYLTLIASITMLLGAFKIIKLG